MNRLIYTISTNLLIICGIQTDSDWNALSSARKEEVGYLQIRKRGGRRDREKRERKKKEMLKKMRR